MKFLLITIVIYSLLGIARIIRDFSQRKIYNQPHYVRHPTILLMIVAFITAPLFWWNEIRRPPIDKEKMQEAKERSKKIFEEIMKKKS